MGMQGLSYVAELILFCLPNTLPSVGNVAEAQTTAHFVWAACLTSNFFNAPEVSPLDEAKVARARNYLWVLLAELLERLLVAPAPMLSFPVTLLALVSNHPAACKSAPMYRMAHLLSKFGYRRLAMALLDPSLEPARDDFLRICAVPGSRTYGL